MFKDLKLTVRLRKKIRFKKKLPIYISIYKKNRIIKIFYYHLLKKEKNLKINYLWANII